MQIPGRTPTNTAMTAATLDLLSGGRLLLGLGTSGPQVVEGWHGQPWGKPLEKTREYVEIVRAALRRDVVEHHGDALRHPVTATEPASASRSSSWRARCARTSRSTSRRWGRRRSPRRSRSRTAGCRSSGRRRRRATRSATSIATRAKPGFDIAATAPVILIDDVEAGREFLKPYYALYIGGMGARGKNFYNDLASPLRLRGRGEEDPGSLPRREQARRGGRDSRRVRRRGRARRAEGADRGADRRLARVRRDVAPRLDAAARSAPRPRRDRPLARRRDAPRSVAETERSLRGGAAQPDQSDSAAAAASARYGTPCSKRAARASSAPSSPRTKRP